MQNWTSLGVINQACAVAIMKMNSIYFTPPQRHSSEDAEESDFNPLVERWVANEFPSVGG